MLARSTTHCIEHIFNTYNKQVLHWEFYRHFIDGDTLFFENEINMFVGDFCNECGSIENIRKIGTYLVTWRRE